MAPVSRPSTTNLLDLPVEIRLAFCEIIIRDEVRRGEHADEKTIGRAPSQPSILQASRTIRNDAIDIWYATARFPIQFRALEWHESKVEPTGTPEYEMLVALPPSAYPKIRRLELCFTETYGLNARYYCFSVDLDARSNSYTIEHTPKTHQWWVGYRPWNLNAHKKAERRVGCLRKRFDTAVAEMIAESGGVGSLSAQNFEHLTPRPCWRFGEDISEEIEA